MDGGNSPNLRPLTVWERQGAWMVALLPCALILMGIRVVTYLVIWPDQNMFSYVTGLGVSSREVTLAFLSFDLSLTTLQVVMSRTFFLAAYYVWGRNFGHLAIGAYIVDRKTMRRIGPGRKLIRGLFQMAISPVYPFVDLMSWGMIIVDREQRRSVNDWVAGTLVVTGDVPPEPEPYAWRSRLAALGNALRPLAPQPR